MININSQNCDKSQLGTGVVECIIREGRPTGFAAVKKGWSVPITDTLDLVDLVQQGILIPFTQAVEFTDNTPEKTTEEFQGGNIAVVRNGKPQFAFKFIKGYPFHAASFSYNSLNNYDFILIFDSGAIMGALSADGTQFKGLSGGMLNTDTYKFTDGAVNANTPIEFQLTSPIEFNKRGAFVTSEELGFDANSELYGIIDTVISGSAAAGTTINATVKALQNSAFDIEGLDTANFRVTVNGNVETISTVAFVNNSYTITMDDALVASDSVVVSLYDASANANVAKVGNQLYRGSSTAFVVS